MEIKKGCDNCACEYMCGKHENMSVITLCYEFDCFAPKEELVRADERSKFIKLLKSELESLEFLENKENKS